MPEITYPSLKTLEIPPPIAEIIEGAQLPAFGAGMISRSASSGLKNLLGEPLGPCVQAGLWLLVGELDHSHHISQSISNSTGSYWHGLMHRQEGDFWNSKYWFRAAGNHPCFKRLGEALSIDPEVINLLTDLQHSLIDDGRFQPAAFSDVVEQSIRTKADMKPLQQIAWFEWQTLFYHSWKEGL